MVAELAICEDEVKNIREKSGAGVARLRRKTAKRTPGVLQGICRTGYRESGR